MSKYHEAIAAQIIGTDQSAYGWVIDKDHLAEEFHDDTTAVGTMGPRDIADALEKRLKNGEGRKFKMYDDDGELYYSGRFVCTEGEEELGEEAFGPLDDFGTPNAGAVRIMYQFTDQHGHKGWETL